jgi:hypothetical protein
MARQSSKQFYSNEKVSCKKKGSSVETEQPLTIACHMKDFSSFIVIRYFTTLTFISLSVYLLHFFESRTHFGFGLHSISFAFVMFSYNFYHEMLSSKGFARNI